MEDKIELEDIKEKVAASEEEESTLLDQFELDEIAEGVPILERLLSQDPTLKTSIEKIIQEHLSKPIAPTTLGTIANGLNHYIEFTDMSYLIAFLSGDSEYGKELKSRASQEMWNWLRMMRALYGIRLKEASGISDKNEQSWREINRRVYFDTVTNTWGMTIEISKYNGERMVLEETLGGALHLVWGIVAALNTVPPDAAVDLIAKAGITDFLADALKLSDIYQPDLLSELADNPEEDDSE